MLLRAILPPEHAAWNRAQGAPYGFAARAVVPRRLRHLPLFAGAVGPFGFQTNNHTRRSEYPWAVEQIAPRPGRRVLEIGGGKSGMQFVLARAGCQVVNVDPGERAHGRGWPVTPELIATLNRRFATDVTLRPCFIEDAGLADDSFDCATSISVLEHIPEPDLARILGHVRRALRPGGTFVLTVDLFLDLEPFTVVKSNSYGKNLSLAWLVNESRMELAHGDRAELCGFPEFDPGRIAARRAELLVGNFEAAVQTLVLRKPTAS
jgi:SAM-dependent methyltransferase